MSRKCLVFVAIVAGQPKINNFFSAFCQFNCAGCLLKGYSKSSGGHISDRSPSHQEINGLREHQVNKVITKNYISLGLMTARQLDEFNSGNTEPSQNH